MAFVVAKCTQCSASLRVDSLKEATICDFCGSPFITEKAINNYNISALTVNIQGNNSAAANLALRAKQFLIESDIKKAEGYIEKALDLDINNRMAQTLKSDPAFDMVRTHNCRVKSGCVGELVVVSIFVNGIKAESLRYGDTVDITLPNIGLNTITLKSPLYRTFSTKIHVKSQRTFVYIKAKYGGFMWLGMDADIRVSEN
ncbi:MAG: hypothetical protein FWG83_05090 [Oscillospiraceae bacterium]|nr:hypothetical protein [Oscillospiraceae bacterium]